MKLYLFSACFPYFSSECFLEDEIKYLCREFDEVDIIPLTGGSVARPVPDNCLVHRPIISSRRAQYLKGLIPIGRVIRVYLKDFFHAKVWKDKRRIKAWAVSYVQSINLVSSATIRNIFKYMSSEHVCYFYWGKGANLLSYFYKGKAHFVSRFHGEWDLWEESSGNYAPIRHQIVSSLDKAIFISQKGEAYFNNRYPDCKTGFYPLGSVDYGECTEPKTENVLKVVSCSSVYPLKRVDLIFNSLNASNFTRIEWTHIGAGVGFESLKLKVEKEALPHIKVNLLGKMTHDDVMTFYKNHHFDLFINLSTNEGVPVSIMEAASFDIPVVATDVGGTSEAVAAQVGILVHANPTKEEVSILIKQMITRSLYSPRLYWSEHYNAEKNYVSFATMLKNL